MDGVTIVNYVGRVEVIEFVYVLVLVIVFSIYAGISSRSWVVGIICVCVTTMLIVYLYDWSNNNLKMQVMIDDDVNYTEFTEHYDVVDQNGSLYTICEK